MKKSRNSPAAKSGAFTDDERWAMHTKHKSWKAHRKAGTLGDWEKKYHPDRTPKYKNKKKSTPKPTVKEKLKVTPKEKKKKQDLNFTTM